MLGSTWAGRAGSGADLAGCASVPGDFLPPQGAFPPGFYSLRGGWVNRPAPEECRRGRRHFWEMPGACGLRPCARTHRKKGLMPHLPVRWGVQQIPRSKSFWRQIDFGADLSRCLERRGSGRLCLGAWRFPSASRGLPPRLLPPFEGVGLIARHLRRL